MLGPCWAQGSAWLDLRSCRRPLGLELQIPRLELDRPQLHTGFLELAANPGLPGPVTAPLPQSYVPAPPALVSSDRGEFNAVSGLRTNAQKVPIGPCLTQLATVWPICHNWSNSMGGTGHLSPFFALCSVCVYDTAQNRSTAPRPLASTHPCLLRAANPWQTTHLLIIAIALPFPDRRAEGLGALLGAFST